MDVCQNALNVKNLERLGNGFFGRRFKFVDVQSEGGFLLSDAYK